MSEQSGKPQPRFRLKVVLAASLGFVACFVVVAYLLGGFDQRINLSRARKHGDAIRAALKEHGKFSDVDVGIYTGLGGAIGISGGLLTVTDDDDFAELKMIVTSTHPPVSVAYFIQRRSGGMYEPPWETGNESK